MPELDLLSKTANRRGLLVEITGVAGMAVAPVISGVQEALGSFVRMGAVTPRPHTRILHEALASMGIPLALPVRSMLRGAVLYLTQEAILAELTRCDLLITESYTASCIQEFGPDAGALSLWISTLRHADLTIVLSDSGRVAAGQEALRRACGWSRVEVQGRSLEAVVRDCVGQIRAALHRHVQMRRKNPR